MKIAFCGECLIEVAPTETTMHQLNFAGDSYNTAYYLAKLQSQINLSYITAVGSDPYSQQLLKTIAKHGIDTSLCLSFKQYLLGLYLIDTDEYGERSFYYYRKDSAAAHLFDHPNIETLKHTLLSYDSLYLTGISFAILDDYGKGQLVELLHQAKEKNIKIIFDNNYRPSLWASRQHARECLERIMPLVDYLFVTFDDEKRLYDDESIESCYRRYKAYNIPLIVIKDGARPCLVADKSGCHSIKAKAVKQVIDTAGAGDAFNAAFLCQYLQHQDSIKAAQSGHELASKVIQTPGALINFSG